MFHHSVSFTFDGLKLLLSELLVVLLSIWFSWLLCFSTFLTALVLFILRTFTVEMSPVILPTCFMSLWRPCSVA